MPAVSTELKEAREGIASKRKELKDIWDAAGSDRDLSKVEVLKALPDTAARLEYIGNLNAEIEDLVQKAAPLEKAFSIELESERQISEGEKMKAHPGHVGEPGKKGADDEDDTDPEGPGVKFKSLGQLVMESDAPTKRGDEFEFDIDAKAMRKTLFESATGWVPETTRTGKLIEAIQQPLSLIDLIPTGVTSQQSVVYMEETTYTNGAAEVAEGGDYPEAALALTEKSSPVRKIAVFLPTTDEQLEDVPQAEGYINRRLPFMVRQRLNSQLANGNGTAPNLRGLTNVAGTQTQAVGTDDLTDASYKAMVKVNVTGGAQANAFVYNQLDWQTVRLMRTADGLYIWGSPQDAGPERLWGLPVVFEQALAQGTQIAGDFANYSEVDIRRGLNVKVSDSHGSFFTQGKLAIRADIRAAFVVYRPSAFCIIS